MEPPRERGGNAPECFDGPGAPYWHHWSRRVNAAESHAGHSTPGGAVPASMEPPRERGGNHAQHRRAKARVDASMEPPRERGGNRTQPLLSRLWGGRGFNGAAA